MTVQAFAKRLTPPIVWEGLRRLRAPRPAPLPSFELLPDGWATPVPDGVQGWDAEEITATYAEKWPRFLGLLAGSGPLGFTHEMALDRRDDLVAHNTVMSFGYAAAQAVAPDGTLSILDWGGGMGHYGALARALLPDVAVTYAAYDVPGLTELGRRELPDARFYDDDSWENQAVDLVVASGALHYAPEWRRLLAQFARVSRHSILITRLPVRRHGPTGVYVQRVWPEIGYGPRTEFRGWLFQRSEFLGAAAENSLVLAREMLVGEHWPIAGADDADVVGFLFRAPPRDLSTHDGDRRGN